MMYQTLHVQMQQRSAFTSSPGYNKFYWRSRYMSFWSKSGLLRLSKLKEEPNINVSVEQQRGQEAAPYTTPGTQQQVGHGRSTKKWHVCSRKLHQQLSKGNTRICSPKTGQRSWAVILRTVEELAQHLLAPFSSEKTLFP